MTDGLPKGIIGDDLLLADAIDATFYTWAGCWAHPKKSGGAEPGLEVVAAVGSRYTWMIAGKGRKWPRSTHILVGLLQEAKHVGGGVGGGITANTETDPRHVLAWQGLRYLLLPGLGFLQGCQLW